MALSPNEPSGDCPSDRPKSSLAFNNPLLSAIDTQLNGRQVYELAEPLTFSLKMGRGDVTVTVPAGFRSDLASTPRFLWCIFPPFGNYQRAAVMHDFLYSTAGECSRFLADALFREGMAQLGVSPWKRFCIYYAVRIFGGRCFRWQ